jgi:hypothetical protein
MGHFTCDTAAKWSIVPRQQHGLGYAKPANHDHILAAYNHAVGREKTRITLR